MRIQNQGFDHVEFVVEEIAKHSRIYERMGFEKVGERHLEDKGTRSVLYAQGFVRILLTQSDGSLAAESQDSIRFLRSQAEGVCVLAIDVDNATEAFRKAVARGAAPAMEPKTFESPQGKVTRAEIWTPGRVRYAFIERKAPGGLKQPALFDEGLVADRLESPSPMGIRVIDHLTNNVSMGEMATWSAWYAKIFDFGVVRRFEITTGRTGLKSDVVQSADHKVKVPINEATEPESQIQEFIRRMKGPGVQHLALLTTDLIDCLQQLRTKDFKFLTVPHTYYETVPVRVPGVTEDLKVLEQHGILLDGEEGNGYLLQIFGEEIVGPFFFEFIQRKGDRGFGEGNFKALFQAMEQDQIRRGVLKPV